MALEFRTLQPVEYYQKHLEAGFRPDGRKLQERRPVSVAGGHVTSADGSSVVRLGTTSVVCGIKLELAPLTDNQPEVGTIVPNVTLPPMCNPHFKPGPPTEEAQSASSFVKQVLDKSECVDLKSLVAVEKHMCWVLYLDIICLDHDGNIRDAALLAALAALKDLRIPSVDFDPDTEQTTVNKDETRSLTLRGWPISTTFSLFQHNGATSLVGDPTWEEDGLGSCSLTIVTLDSGDICLVKQTGSNPIESSVMQDAFSLAAKHSSNLLKVVKSL